MDPNKNQSLRKVTLRSCNVDTCEEVTALADGHSHAPVMINTRLEDHTEQVMVENPNRDTPIQCVIVNRGDDNTIQHGVQNPSGGNTIQQPNNPGYNTGLNENNQRGKDTEQCGVNPQMIPPTLQNPHANMRLEYAILMCCGNMLIIQRQYINGCLIRHYKRKLTSLRSESSSTQTEIHEVLSEINDYCYYTRYLKAMTIVLREMATAAYQEMRNPEFEPSVISSQIILLEEQVQDLKIPDEYYKRIKRTSARQVETNDESKNISTDIGAFEVLLRQSVTSEGSGDHADVRISEVLESQKETSKKKQK